LTVQSLRENMKKSLLKAQKRISLICERRKAAGAKSKQTNNKIKAPKWQAKCGHG